MHNLKSIVYVKYYVKCNNNYIICIPDSSKDIPFWVCRINYNKGKYFFEI